MEWIVGILALVLVMQIALYRKSLQEGRDLANYALLILLDETVYAAQRKGLSDLVRTIDAKKMAGDLGAQINISLVRLARRLGDTLLGVRDSLSRTF
jgi:hypothetical protein